MICLPLFNHYMKEIMGMTVKNGFNERISALGSLLQAEWRVQLEMEEISYLHDRFSSWMTLFEVAGLLWEFRFNKFLRELLVLCTDGNIDELRAMARDFYLQGKNAHDASREYKSITAKRRKDINAIVETTPENSL